MHRTHLPPLAGCRGLTLVEVLMAIIILGIGTTMLGTAMARSVSAVSDSRLDLAAATAGVDRLEMLRSAVADSCPPASAGGRTLASGLVERWQTVRNAGAIDLLDSLIPAPTSAHPVRVLMAQVSCP